MPDMLVKLYDLPEDAQTACPRDESVQIRRAMAPDKFRVVEWVKEHSGLSAAGECDVCFARPAVSCFIATRGKKILGYACYDATAPDFFGPTRVLDEEQGGGIGRALLLQKGKLVGDVTTLELEEHGKTLMDFVKKTYRYKADRVVQALKDLTGEEEP